MATRVVALVTCVQTSRYTEKGVAGAANKIANAPLEMGDPLISVGEPTKEDNDELPGFDVLPGREVPQKIARRDKQILHRIQAVAAPSSVEKVDAVNHQVDAGDRPADKMNLFDTRDGERQVQPVQLTQPHGREEGRRQKQIAEQNPVQIQVELWSGWRARAGFEVVDSPEAVLLHQRVLLVPQDGQQQHRDRSVNESGQREAHDDNRSANESGSPASAVVNVAEGPHPGGKVVRNRDPQSNGCHRDRGQPLLAGQSGCDGHEGQRKKPDRVGSAAENVAGLKHETPRFRRWAHHPHLKRASRSVARLPVIRERIHIRAGKTSDRFGLWQSTQNEIIT